MEVMEFFGLLKIRVIRGINLAVRDTLSSDPYVVITMGHQKVKSPVIKDNCNPVWNVEMTLAIRDPNLPIILTLYDKDTFTVDDHMGDAEIDIQPYLEAMKLVSQGSQSGAKVGRIDPSWENCLADESCIVWKDGKLTQEMILRLRHVECGEVEIQIEVIDAPSPKGKGILF
ncbi:protein C2-DOMAIN ABA-RELATED 7-like [Ipomoea triloba]|uniref:protein C2-DOMAIN ABA-RELATED 7-like n=1 Tax=Ipomoea triloba TaxID=35885 RepID=UPI00125E946B|nr:protein C2-DOMAIN ABA-RELATED 7-like [Ipomoea triloba]GMD23453.1 protein C2-DOMAIN ABA-RELATED 7-like [Ipomoea batatas]GMD26615.1 protein C2-DOMAIN ABA-RELATED 7-like [Ipomoea batatas]